MPVLLCFILIAARAGAKEKVYTASTPAGTVVRNFLGIVLSDSVDFIRWKIVLNDTAYQLYCNYGISKPNTAGFIGDGKKIELNGRLGEEKNYCVLWNGSKRLKMAVLNTNIFHVMDADSHLLVGNGGWSYSLNRIAPVISNQAYSSTAVSALKDSMVLEGRTPCQVPGIIAAGSTCYKLKWRIILYANAAAGKPGTYIIFSTTFRKDGGKKGTWRIDDKKNGQIIYQLYDDKGNALLRLSKLDENIFAFTDASEKLLVGDEDFSYTLNRVK